MANYKISDLPLIPDIPDGAYVPVVSGGKLYKADAKKLAYRGGVIWDKLDNLGRPIKVRLEIPDPTKIPGSIMQSYINTSNIWEPHGIYYWVKTLDMDMSLVDTIEDYAFYGCANLRDLDFPNVASVGTYAFYRCSNLIDMEFPLLTEVKDYTFYESTKLEQISLPMVTSIGPRAFAYCRHLKSINVPVVESIAEYAFYYAGLEAVNLPAIKTIERNAFSQCPNLTSVEMANVTELTGESIFYNCTSLTSIRMPKLKALPNKFLYKCTALKEIKATDFPSVTSLGSDVFRDCTALESVILSGLTILPAFTFTMTKNLKIASFPSVEKVNTGAFNIRSLTSLTFGSPGHPVTSIAKSAFTGGFDLSALTITVYTTGGAELENAPWGAKNATIIYKEA